MSSTDRYTVADNIEHSRSPTSPCPRLVDTGYAAFARATGCFEYCISNWTGADLPQGGVAATPVVAVLDPLADGQFRPCLRGPDSPVVELGLQGCEERLCHRVVYRTVVGRVVDDVGAVTV